MSGFSHKNQVGKFPTWSASIGMESLQENKGDRVQECLENAAYCEKRAASATDPAANTRFVEIACCWHELARCWREFSKDASKHSEGTAKKRGTAQARTGGKRSLAR
jgi:hypothetical protein